MRLLVTILCCGSGNLSCTDWLLGCPWSQVASPSDEDDRGSVLCLLTEVGLSSGSLCKASSSLTEGCTAGRTGLIFAIKNNNQETKQIKNKMSTKVWLKYVDGITGLSRKVNCIVCSFQNFSGQNGHKMFPLVYDFRTRFKNKGGGGQERQLVPFFSTTTWILHVGASRLVD